MPRRAYYAARAIAERRRAQAATDPRVATVHAELSARYEALSSDPSLDLLDSDLAGAELRVSELLGSELAESELPALEPSTVGDPAR